MCASFLLFAPITSNSQWTQWRGTERNGSIPGDALKGEWLPNAVMLWQQVVGNGLSGPIVSGDRIWVHSRKAGREVVSSLALNSGKIIWSRSYNAPFKQDPTAAIAGLGPFSTPALAGGRLFTFSVNAVLSCWDAQSGTLLWRKEYSSDFDPSYPIFGMSISPLVWEDRCFVHFGSSGREALDEKGAIIALRASDGNEIWRWAGDGPALGASPVLAVIKNDWQLIFKTENNIVGLHPRTGKELWRIPFKVSMDNTIVTPLIIGDKLLTSDYEMGFCAWHIQSDGNSWSAQEIWKNRSLSLSTSSPVVVGDQVFGFTHFRKGQLFGIDPGDGKIVWRGEARWGEWAPTPLISCGDNLLAFKEDGTLVVAKVSRDGLLSQRRYRLGNYPMWGHPAIAGRCIFTRDGNRLVAWRIMKETERTRVDLQ